jgi:hypothetical protein
MKDLDSLLSAPSYTWPANAASLVEQGLDSSAPDVLLRSLGLAGDLVVMNHRIANRLLAIIASSPSVPARTEAALAFGPALEQAFEVGLDNAFDGSFDEPALTPELFHRVRATLRTIFHDPSEPDDLRRASLRSSIHAPDSWHPEAVSAAYVRAEPAWKGTALYCMGRLPAFESELLAALESSDENLQCEAVRSAAMRQVEAAGTRVLDLASRTSASGNVRRAAVEALGWLCPPGSEEILRQVVGSDDRALADLADQALRERRAFSDPPAAGGR